MSLKWSRYYHGMLNDHIWRSIANKTDSNISEVFSVYMYLFDLASSNRVRGSISNYDIEDISAALNLPENKIKLIIDSLNAKEVIKNNHFVDWHKEQPNCDANYDYTATERKRRQRANEKLSHVTLSEEVLSPNTCWSNYDNTIDKSSSIVNDLLAINATSFKEEHYHSTVHNIDTVTCSVTDTVTSETPPSLSSLPPSSSSPPITPLITTSPLSPNSTTPEKSNDFSIFRSFSEKFWSEYPKKVGKKAVMKKIKLILSSREATQEQILKGLEQYKQTKTVKEGFILNPLTWLNQGRWDDELEVVSPKAGEGKADVCACGKHSGVGVMSHYERAQSKAFERERGVYGAEKDEYLVSYETAHGKVKSSFLIAREEKAKLLAEEHKKTLGSQNSQDSRVLDSARSAGNASMAMISALADKFSIGIVKNAQSLY